MPHERDAANQPSILPRPSARSPSPEDALVPHRTLVPPLELSIGVVGSTREPVGHRGQAEAHPDGLIVLGAVGHVLGHRMAQLAHLRPDVHRDEPLHQSILGQGL